MRGLSYDIRTSEHQIELAYLTTGGWRTASLAASTVSDTRSIIELSNLGIGVTSHTAGILVQFLDDYRVANHERIPTVQTTAVMGWQQNCDLYVVGRQSISNGVRGSNSGQIQFRHPDDGTDAIADGYSAAGTLEQWCQVVAPVMRFPKIRFTVYATITPPLLRLIDGPNYVIDICGETSQGKTTTLEIGAGRRESGSKSRRTGRNHLDVGHDTGLAGASHGRHERPAVFPGRTKVAPFVEDVAKMIYMATGGQERGRGTIHGTRRRESFRTVLFTTGEEPLIKLTKHGGVRPRVLTLWGCPFGNESDETAALILTTRDGLRANHGHFLPRFAEFLIQRCNATTLKATLSSKDRSTSSTRHK